MTPASFLVHAFVQTSGHDDDLHHVTVCEPHPGEGACCNRSLCGLDLTDVPWTNGDGEMPCPLCHELDEEGW